MGDIDQNKVIYADEFRGPNKEVRVLSAFCYIPYFGIFTPFFLDSIVKNPNSQQVNLSANDFVKFHLTQAYVLFGIHFISLFVPGINFTLTFFLYIALAAIHAKYGYKGEAFRLWGVRNIFPVEAKILEMSINPPSLSSTQATVQKETNEKTQ